MPKVLITGATGFTGNYLIHELKSNAYDVVGTTALFQKVTSNISLCDIRNLNSLTDTLLAHKPDYIVHLAGLSHAANSEHKDLFDINLFGTENLLRAIASHLPNIQKVILASSANVYGNVRCEVISEDLCPKPVNYYASSKLAMEHMARTWCNKIPLTIVRPFNYTGIGQKDSFLIPKIVSHFKQKADCINLGNLDVFRDFSDVRDVCKSYRLILNADTIGKTINICSGTLVSLGAIIEMCTQLSGHEIQVEVNPLFVRENEIKKLRGSNNLLQSIGGYFEYRKIEDTLEWMLNKF